MKKYMLAFVLFRLFTVNAASCPYGDEALSPAGFDAKSESSYDGDSEDSQPASNVSFPTSRAKSVGRVSGSSHAVVDVDLAEENIERPTKTTTSESSLQSFPPVDPIIYVDRDAYLKNHVNGMMKDEKRYKLWELICRGCNVSWLGIGGASTASSLIISAIGATEYMDPQLSNVISVVCGVVSGGCLWAATQSKKASREYHEEVVNIQESLGVPKKWVEKEVDLGLEPFKPGGRAVPAR